MSRLDRVLTGHLVRRCLLAVIFLSLAPVANAIEEIIVTVRKREENLQDIPLSVTALSGAEITRKGIADVTDVAKYTASIQFKESFAQSDTRIAVRGLSPTRGRQNVALLLDGIDVSSESITSSGGSLLINFDLIDVERIEVVTGPSMVQFGRSAFAGAIQYVTKDPSDEFEIEGVADVNNEEHFSLKGSVSGPIFGDKLGFRLNGAWWDREGFYKNTLTNSTVGSDDGFGGALTFVAAPLDNLKLRWRSEFIEEQSLPSAQAFLRFNTELPTPPNALLPIDQGGTSIAKCFPDFIAAISAGVPGNDAALQTRINRIMDPGFPNPTGGGGANCEEVTPSFVGQVPDGDDLSLILATDPTTPGQDYAGFDQQLFRTSFIAELALDRGNIAVRSGYTRDRNTETQDTSAFGVRSTSIFGDDKPVSFSFNNYKETEQLQFELLYTSNLEGPVNVTMGGLYWDEKVDNRSRSVTGQSAGSHCFWVSLSGTLNPFNSTDGCTGYTETPIGPYQQAIEPFRSASPADRDTQHMSVFGSAEIVFASDFTLTLEGRYHREEVDVFGPIFFDPGASGGPGGFNPCGIFFRACEPFDQWVAGGKWFSDSFFPYTDEDADGNPIPGLAPGETVLDQALLDSIPDLCRQQDPAALQRSIDESPFIPVLGSNGNPTLDSLGAPVIATNADGTPMLNPNATDTFNPWCVDSLGRNESWFTPKVILDWRATEETLLYASWARAQKPGGLSLLTVGSSGLDRELAEFDPEKMEVWELGMNSQWFDRTLVVNGALFFQDFTDKQALSSALGNDGRLVSRIVNAGKAEVYGLELTVGWRPDRNFLGGSWALSGSYTYIDSEYVDFEVNTASPVTAAGAGNCVPAQVGDSVLCRVSYTGNELEDSPEHSLVGSVEYRRALTNELDIFVETAAQFTDEKFTNITNAAWTDSFWNVDLSLGIEARNWGVIAYVTNALDDDTVQFSGGGPGLGCCFILGSGIDITGVSPDLESVVMVDLPLFSSAFLPEPRLIGVRARYKFGGN